MNLRSCFRLLALAAILSTVPAAQADWAILRSGQSLHIAGYEFRGSVCILHLAGGEVRLPASAILRFEPEDFFPSPAVHSFAPSTPFAPLVTSAARKNDLDPGLLSSVIRAESNFQPRAISSKGALGLMQLMPGTAHSLAVHDPFDPSENIQAGARYLKGLLGKFGNLNLALAAYNAGPATVRLYRGIPPYSETRAYIARIHRDWKQYDAPHDFASDTRKLTCSPLALRCSEQAVPVPPVSGQALP